MRDDVAESLGGRSREQVLADAAAYGVDISLLRAQLLRSVDERLRLLEANVTFVREARAAAARRRTADAR